MANLYYSGIRRCVDCGRLFGPKANKDLCSQCFFDRYGRPANPDEPDREDEYYPDDLFGLKPEEAFIPDEERKSRDMIHEKVPECSRCHRRPRETGSAICFTCRLALHKAFAQAAREMYLRPYQKPAGSMTSTASAHSILDAMDERRSHTGTGRIDPSGRQIKTY